MSLKLDLRGDFYKCVENEVQRLIADGFKFSSKEKDVSYIAEFYNLIERIPVPRPRKILKAKTFSCPKELQKNLEVLENKIVKGKSITNYLSKKIIDAHFSDSMLYDFGITHLHLGKEGNSRDEPFVERTGKILYCFLTDDNAYFLTIDDHGKWSDIKLIEIIKDNFPEVLKKHELTGIISLKHKVTNEEREKLHKHNIFPLLQLNDKVYNSLGGGVMLNGFSRRGMLTAINQLRFFDYLEKEAQAIYDDNKESIIIKTGNIEDIEFHFENLDNPLVLYDKNNEYKIDIIWNPQNINEVSIDFNKYKKKSDRFIFEKDDSVGEKYERTRS